MFVKLSIKYFKHVAVLTIPLVIFITIIMSQEKMQFRYLVLDFEEIFDVGPNIVYTCRV